MPNELKEEELLLKKMKMENIKLNIDFLNSLIRRRLKRNDPENASVLKYFVIV
jgi:hypothetical protein